MKIEQWPLSHCLSSCGNPFKKRYHVKPWALAVVYEFRASKNVLHGRHLIINLTSKYLMYGGAPIMAIEKSIMRELKRNTQA